jgi:hypothetical protein
MKKKDIRNDEATNINKQQQTTTNKNTKEKSTRRRYTYNDLESQEDHIITTIHAAIKMPSSLKASS